jgi:nitric oxide reductase subunit C
MKVSHAKGLFIWGTLLSSLIFLILTYDSLFKMPQRTHEDKLTREVAAGKWVWQKHNCNDCHTILGIGGYYAPDVTKVAGYRDADWLQNFLRDPEKVWPAERKMPNLHLKDQEIDNLIEFLTWVNGIDTNNWPPKPVEASSETVSAPSSPTTKKEQHGAELFRSLGCTACHTIGGIGGHVGPDLTKVGSRRDKEWIEEQIQNPKSHNPNSLMPSFASLPEKDREDLADYLSGLR